MFYLFITTIPFIALSVVTVMGKDLLLNYFMMYFVVIEWLLMQQRRFKAYFDSRGKWLLIFVALSIMVNMAVTSQVFNIKMLTQNLNAILILSFFLLLTNYLVQQEYSTIRKYLDYFIYVCVLLSIFTFYQYYAGSHNLPLFDYFRNASLYMMANTLAAAGSWSQSIRVYGVAPEPSMWAAMILVPISLLLPFMFEKRSWPATISFIMLNMSFFLSVSRTGFLSYLFVALIYLFYKLRKRKERFRSFPIFTVLAIVYTSAVFFIEMLQKSYITDYSFVERLAGQIIAFKMFVSSPIFGVGLGNYSLYFPDYLNSALERILIYKKDIVGSFTYNLYIRLLAETGLVGFLIFMIFLYSLYRVIFYVRTLPELSREQGVFVTGLELAYYSILFSWFNIEGFNFMYIWFVFATISVLPAVMRRAGAE
jgi:O-antigen ligase